MKNVYEIVFDGIKTNDYIRGRISGIGYVLTGMPEKTFGWCIRDDEENRWIWKLGATQEEYKTVVYTIEKVYPGVIIHGRMNDKVTTKEDLA